MSETPLLRTAVHDWHASHGGRMVDFAGWSMPVQYTTIATEHQAVRKAAGLFDIAHMGRLWFTGPDAVRFLDHLVTNDVTSLQVGQVQYALVTNEAGGILDDVLVTRFPESCLLVVNASNRLKILDWISRNRSGFQFEMEDRTLTHFMLALQGPFAERRLQPLTGVDLKQIRYYWAAQGKVLGHEAIVSRTGYTGEDGFEVILPAAAGLELWERLLAEDAALPVQPCGLGCRDTLRLEAAMPLYGHELDEQTDPFTAGLAFAVKLEAGEFIGRDALRAAKANTQRPKRVGLELAGKRIAREGTALFFGDRPAGRVTSGTWSPTLEKSLAMAYVPADCAGLGTVLEADIRGQRQPATIVKLPFYRRAT